MLATLERYVRKAVHLGPIQTLRVISTRMTQQWYIYRIRAQAKTKKLGVSWDFLQKKYTIKISSADFIDQLRTLSYPFVQHYLETVQIDKKEYRALAHNYIEKKFDLLGSGEHQFSGAIAWHQDFRLAQQDSKENSFFPAHFSKDITIQSGSNDELKKDIKLPWELSRFQHLFVLGNMYHKKSEAQYVHAFVEQITDWLENNPVLIGPNWVCPMDVGLRALNWIWGFYFFKDAQEVSPDFWEKFVCSLYDHADYLENNWELYDSRTSNHYLSDLVGYFYCCYFFSYIPAFAQKAAWCHAEILREFEKQVFEEGTDYEGSTQYHKLVTELFYHWYLVAVHGFGYQVDDMVQQKLQRMVTFINWCTPVNGNLISIGDHDSGKVLHSFFTPSEFKNENFGIKKFDNFGLSVLKTKNIHLSLRHHVYDTRQPSGHFHNDVGSITLNHKGVDIFVDPGSYVYTPSAVWRNRFRSVNMHNSFFVENHEPVPFDERLFALDIPTNHTNSSEQEFVVNHDLYTRFGLRAQREISFLKNNDDGETVSGFIITDQWKIEDKKNQGDFVSVWNFTLGPTLQVQLLINGFLLSQNKKPLVSVETDMSCEIVESFVSYEYGNKVKTQAVRMKKKLDEVPVKIRCNFL